jgi:hypothetical protein
MLANATGDPADTRADVQRNFKRFIWKPDVSTAEMCNAAKKDPVDFAPGARR